MVYDVLFETSPWHSRAALFDERGQLLTLRLDDPSRQTIESAVILGRVQSIQPGLKAAFVDVGDTRPGFLPLPKELRVTAGQALLVRVARSSDLEKGARLDARVSMKPPANPSTIPCMVLPAPSALRRALMDAGDTPVRCWVVDARTEAAATAVCLAERVFRLSDHPDMGLLAALDLQLDEFQGGVFPLPKGQLTVETTKALVAIDVDAGDLTGPSGRVENVLTLNYLAAAEVQRLCRLLDLGGNIIVDFIGLPKPWQRKKVTEYLAECFAQRDMNKVTVNPMSRHGLVEINRERRGAMLPELLEYPAYVAGRICLQLARTAPRPVGGNITIQAHPTVIDLLEQRLTTHVCLEQFGRPVTLQPQTHWPIAKFWAGD